MKHWVSKCPDDKVGTRFYHFDKYSRRIEERVRASGLKKRNGPFCVCVLWYSFTMALLIFPLVFTSFRHFFCCVELPLACETSDSTVCAIRGNEGWENYSRDTNHRHLKRSGHWSLVAVFFFLFLSTSLSTLPSWRFITRKRNYIWVHAFEWK